MSRPTHVASRSSASQTWTMLGFGLVIAAAVLVVWPSASPSSTDASATTAAPPRPEQEAAQILRMWDRARSEAWALGDENALRSLYVDGASAARADVRMLRQWRRRGLRVQGLTMQVAQVEVVVHEPTRWQLKVTDRIAAADVVGPGVESEMPPGATRTRVVELRIAGGTWRMASVKPA